jgi:hypothetical protein
MSFLFEPGEINIMNNDDHNVKITSESYISSPAPTEFPRYIKEFAHDKSTIFDGPAMCTCQGLHGKREHLYLANENSFECDDCKHSFCQTCAFIPEVDNKMSNKKKKEGKIYYEDCSNIRCIDCFRFSRLGSNSNESITSSTVHKPINEIIAELS